MTKPPIECPTRKIGGVLSSNSYTTEAAYAAAPASGSSMGRSGAIAEWPRRPSSSISGPKHHGPCCPPWTSPNVALPPCRTTVLSYYVMEVRSSQSGRARERHVVGRVSELPPGSVTIVKVQNPHGVGVFNVNGTFYALKNVCPHQGGPLCSGPVTGTTRAVHRGGEAPAFEWIREGEIVRCPWHRWEFDIATGQTVFASTLRVARYPVTVEPADELPRVETYPVKEEDGLVILEI